MTTTKEVSLVPTVGEKLSTKKPSNITVPVLSVNVTKVCPCVCTNTGLTGTNLVIVSGQNLLMKVFSSLKTDVLVAVLKSMNLLAKVTTTISSVAVFTLTWDPASQPEITTENSNAVPKVKVLVPVWTGMETCTTDSLNAVITVLSVLLEQIAKQNKSTIKNKQSHPNHSNETH